VKEGVRRFGDMRNAKMGGDHRRERLVSLVSLVRLSSELALPVEGIIVSL
jgi:hypothetical protein